MLDSKSGKHYTDEKIIKDLIRIISEISNDWEFEFIDSIGPDTLLGEDLALKSIDVVRLLSSIQELYNRHDFPFNELLMPDDQPVKDVSISEIAGFLSKCLARN